MKEPVFIIGTERSGTNLLRLILNSHPSIAVPHPPHILKNFFGLEPRYGDLSRDANFRALINDVVTLVELHPYPWEMKIDRGRIFREAGERDLISIFFAVYDQYREEAGKERWACKSTFMINHVALVRKYRPGAKFIFMVRDGRDVAASAKRSIFNRYNVYFTARLWQKEQRTGMFWLDSLPPSDIMLLKYEDLLRNPEEAVRNVCEFLGEAYVPSMIEFFKSDEAKKSGSLSVSWENTSMPVISGNTGKFQKELREDEIDLFEAIAGQELEYFGYALARPAYISEGERARGIRLRFGYLVEEFALMARQQLRHLLNDKNSALRMRKWLFMRFVRAARAFG